VDEAEVEDDAPEDLKRFKLKPYTTGSYKHNPTLFFKPLQDNVAAFKGQPMHVTMPGGRSVVIKLVAWPSYVVVFVDLSLVVLCVCGLIYVCVHEIEK
jgi:hypothetical protein